MANPAKSHVQVSIGGMLDPSYAKSFSAADKRMQEFARTTADANKKVADVGAYRRQQNALKETATAYSQARAKVAALKAEMSASEAPTRKQAAALNAAERAAKRAGAAYTEARTKLADMSRQLQQNGVQVGKLSTEYRRLQGEATKAAAAQAKAEQSLARQQKIVAGMASAWRGIGAAVAGVAGAAMVLKAPAAKAMNYDEQLARLADTASGSPSEYKSAKGQLSEAVQAALKASGGGKREDVLGGLSTLIASGGMPVGQATQDIVPIARMAFASNTSADQIAQLALKMKSFGVNDTGAGLDVLYRSGRLGGVELSDMAKYLPEQMAAARSAGYSGLRGLSEIGAMNQVGLSAAGSPEQAANNVINLLNKLSSPELSKNVSKVTGVDFDKYSLENQKKGIYKAESFAMLADKQMAKDKRYVALKNEAESAKTPQERAAKVNEMATMLEGSGMGKLIQDRQALAEALALVVGRRTGEYKRQQEGAFSGAGGASMTLSNLGGEVFAKTQTAQSAIDRANEQTFNSLSGPMGTVLDVLNKATQAFPTLTTAVYAAATALTAIVGAGAAGGLYKILTKTPPPVPPPSAAPAAATSIGARIAAARAAAIPALSKAAPWAARASVFTAPLSLGGDTPVAGSPEAQWNERQRAIRLGLKKQYGDDVIDKARKEFRPWWKIAPWTSAENDQEYVQKYVGKAKGLAPPANSGVTITNQYDVKVITPPGADAAQMKAAAEEAVRAAQRKAEAEQRSLLTDRTGH